MRPAITTHLIGVLVCGASYAAGGARAFSERAVSDKFFNFRFSWEIRSETPQITVFEEERLVKNARPSVTTQSADPPTKLGSSM